MLKDTNDVLNFNKIRKWIKTPILNIQKKTGMPKSNSKTTEKRTNKP
jgi:hypothetical protein